MTGAGGFIGGHTAAALKRVCAKLLCFTNNAASADGHSRLYLDFADEQAVLQAIKTHGLPDAFAHLGWAAMTDPGSDEHMGANVAMSSNLISTLFREGLSKFVFLGSANEYGARAGALTEDMSPEGRMTKYAEAKVAVTSIGLAKAKEFNRVFVNVRPFYVYGPGQRGGSLPCKLYRCYLTKTRAELGPCEHYRDYVYVGEVAEGVRRAATQISESGVVNVGTGHVVTVRQFVETMWKRLGCPPENLVFGANPMRAGEPEQPYAYADTSRIRRLTGWAPSISLEEGIRLLVNGLHARRETDFADV